MAHRIAIVGNAPTDKDNASAIDAADTVVRFNNAFGYGSVTGTKIDDLFLVNCGGQPLEWLRSQAFSTRDYLSATRRITFPFAAPYQTRVLPFSKKRNPQNIDSLNFEWDLRDALRSFRMDLRALSSETVNAAINTLRQSKTPVEQIAPSTGYLAIYSYLEECAQEDIIDLYGFTFSGWGGHSWSAERAWVTNQEKRGRVRLHQP